MLQRNVISASCQLYVKCPDPHFAMERLKTALDCCTCSKVPTWSCHSILLLCANMCMRMRLSSLVADYRLVRCTGLRRGSRPVPGFSHDIPTNFPPLCLRMGCFGLDFPNFEGTCGPRYSLLTRHMSITIMFRID